MVNEQGDRPDLAVGVSLADFKNGTLLGRVGEEEVLLIHTETEVFAIDPHCSHYHGPLAEGLLVGTTVRCPWHHACFDLRTGEAVRAPALSPLGCWDVMQEGETIKVGQKRKRSQPQARIETGAGPDRIVIVGGGAAGFAAAEMLRRVGYRNSIVMLSGDTALPYDRPNLSKDYLAGTIPFDYVPLRDESFYRDNGIDIRLGSN